LLEKCFAKQQSPFSHHAHRQPAPLPARHHHHPEGT